MTRKQMAYSAILAGMFFSPLHAHGQSFASHDQGLKVEMEGNSWFEYHQGSPGGWKKVAQLREIKRNNHYILLINDKGMYQLYLTPRQSERL